MERRLAAILVADVVGYSRLMERDEAGTMAALTERRKAVWEPLLAKHRGRVIRTKGDGTLAEFMSAVDAVQCAVDVQRAMREANTNVSEDCAIVLRVGLNLGDVMVEDGDLYGDGVNVAARLEAMADPGGIYLSAAIHQQVERLLPLAFKDLGDQELKNIARPVRVYSISHDVAAAGGLGVPVNRVSSAASKPSIAVLPFTNMSGDPEQEYFSDGITEDIITELSRFRNLTIIARNSSFVFKGKSANIDTIARELSVEYVLEGSVRRAGQRVRITAQLIHAKTNNHIWAERYDRELADIFAVQDEVTRRIVGTLAVELEESSLAQARRKPPQSLRAYEHWLQGMSLLTLPGRNPEARRHFEQAIAVDPNYSRGYSGLAETYFFEVLDFQLPRPSLDVTWEKAFCSAQKAVALDDTDYWAHLTMSWWHLYQHNCDLAKKHLNRACTLNPNAADMLASATYIFAALGEPEQGIEAGRSALLLNPHHPDWYLGFLATALFTARRYSEALEVRLRAPTAFVDSPFFAAAILAHMGRIDEAKIWANKAVAALAATPAGAPAVAEGRVVELLLENNPYCRQEDRDHFAEGMRRAGIPG